MAQQRMGEEVASDSSQAALITALNRLKFAEVGSDYFDESNPVHQKEPMESFFGFELAELHFMISARYSCEVFVDLAISSLPNAPECLVGLSNIRGTIVPIYQLHSILDATRSEKTIALVVGKGESAIGLIVDALPMTLSLSASMRMKTGIHENIFVASLVNELYVVNQEQWKLLSGDTLGFQLTKIANSLIESKLHSLSERVPS